MEGQTRHVQNDEGLVEVLSRKFGGDFVAFTGDGQTFQEQIDLFRTARLVFGPHGAGLANLVFCPPGTKFLEFPITPPVLNHYAHLAMALDLEYWVVPEVSTHYLGSYRLDDTTRDLVVELIEQLC